MKKNKIFIGNDSFRVTSVHDPYARYMKYAYRKDTRRLRNLAFTLKKNYKFNGSIADVGANIGITTMILSKIFKDSNIFAFEANPEIFKILLENLKEYKNIKLFRKAVSDGTEANLEFFGISAFGHVSKKNSKSSIKVSAVTLKEVLKEQGIQKFDLVKIDVEGFELDVFKGLGNSAKVIFFEFNPYCINAFYEKSCHKVLSNIFLKYKLFKFKSDHELEEIISKRSLEGFILNTFRKNIINDLVAIPRKNSSLELFKNKKLIIHKYPENIFGIMRSIFWLLYRFLLIFSIKKFIKNNILKNFNLI